jgi:hypothetical protein
MNQSDQDEAPTVDLTGFNTYSEPNLPFIVLDPQSQAENDRLMALLGVGTLIEALAKKVEEPKQWEFSVLCEMHTVAQTDSGRAVVVALQLAMLRLNPKKKRDWKQNGQWVAFTVEPEDYDELEAEVESTFKQYRQHLESMVRGAEQKN